MASRPKHGCLLVKAEEAKGRTSSEGAAKEPARYDVTFVRIRGVELEQQGCTQTRPPPSPVLVRPARLSL